MKKIFKLMAIIIVVSTLAVTGCGKKSNKVVEHNTSNENIEVKDDLENATLLDTKSYNAEYISEPEGNAEDAVYKKVFVVFKRYVSDEKEFAIIKGYDNNDKVMWTYKTEKIEAGGQGDGFDLLGGTSDYEESSNVIIRENANVTILDAKTGKKQNSFKLDHSNAKLLGTARKIENNGNGDYKDYIFVAGLYLPTDGIKKIYAIDMETYKVVKTVELPEEYMDYSYETKEVDTDIYIEFEKYTAMENVNNKYGFYITDVLNKNFKAKEIVIK